MIDWMQTASQIDCQIRGLNPWPGVYTFNAKGQRLKVLEAIVAADQNNTASGKIIDRLGHISCGQGTLLKLVKVQPDNAKPMDIAAAFNGRYLEEAAQLGISSL